MSNPYVKCTLRGCAARASQHFTSIEIDLCPDHFEDMLGAFKTIIKVEPMLEEPRSVSNGRSLHDNHCSHCGTLNPNKRLTVMDSADRDCSVRICDPCRASNHMPANLKECFKCGYSMSDDADILVFADGIIVCTACFDRCRNGMHNSQCERMCAMAA